MRTTVDLNKLKKIVQKIQNGDESAFGEFYDLTHKAIYRFSFFLSKNESLAHDLCHDSFVKALVSIKDIKDQDAVLGWLFRITKNTFLDQRKKKTEEALPDAEINLNGISPDFERWLSVKKALNDFSEEDRMLLIMVDLEGLTYKEAALAIETTEDAIRMKLHRLRQEFLKKYKTPETF